MGKFENRHQDGRFPSKHIHNHIQCQLSKPTDQNQKCSNGIKKQDAAICNLKETYFKYKDDK